MARGQVGSAVPKRTPGARFRCLRFGSLENGPGTGWRADAPRGQRGSRTREGASDEAGPCWPPLPASHVGRSACSARARARPRGAPPAGRVKSQRAKGKALVSWLCPARCLPLGTPRARSVAPTEGTWGEPQEHSRQWPFLGRRPLGSRPSKWGAVRLLPLPACGDWSTQSVTPGGSGGHGTSFCRSEGLKWGAGPAGPGRRWSRSHGSFLQTPASESSECGPPAPQRYHVRGRKLGRVDRRAETDALRSRGAPAPALGSSRLPVPQSCFSRSASPTHTHTRPAAGLPPRALRRPPPRGLGRPSASFPPPFVPKPQAHGLGRGPALSCPCFPSLSLAEIWGDVPPQQHLRLEEQGHGHGAVEAPLRYVTRHLLSPGPVVRALSGFPHVLSGLPMASAGCPGPGSQGTPAQDGCAEFP